MASRPGPKPKPNRGNKPDQKEIQKKQVSVPRVSCLPADWNPRLDGVRVGQRDWRELIDG